MSRPADDIVKVIRKKREELVATSYSQLRERSVSLVNEMMKDGTFSSEMELFDDDMDGLSKVTDDLRDLNYKYCLIEEQNEDGEVLGYRLRISLAHLNN